MDDRSAIATWAREWTFRRPVHAMTPDLGGTREWNNVEEVAFPAFLAVLPGVVPEGDLTHGRRAGAGPSAGKPYVPD
jgi:hypothetical protein